MRKVGPARSWSPGRRRNPETGEIEPYRIVKGGRAFIWPVLERVDLLSLEIMTIEVITDDVYTSQGVAITLEGVAQIKIASDDVSIRTAAERFLSKSRAEIINVAHETLAGHLRAIIGVDRRADLPRAGRLRASVQDVSASDLAAGLGIDTFVIRTCAIRKVTWKLWSPAHAGETRRHHRRADRRHQRQARTDTSSTGVL